MWSECRWRPLQIIQSLDEDPAAQNKQLTLRLQQIAAALENKVTDLWPPPHSPGPGGGRRRQRGGASEPLKDNIKGRRSNGMKKGRGGGEGGGCDLWTKVGGANNATGRC